MRGMPRIRPRSSLIWCVAPSGPTVRPAWEQNTFTFKFVYATFWRMMLYVCAEPNTEYVVAKGIFPAAARPAATEIMFGSAILSWKKRYGMAFPISIVFRDYVLYAYPTKALGFSR